MNHVITRWNHDFGAPEYMSTNGRDFTLHLDKANVYGDAALEHAARWAGEANAMVCTVEQAHVDERLLGLA